MEQSRAAPFWFQKFISIRSQVLGPIKRPLTTSFNSNIRKTVKMGIKLKYGETPTSRSLRKLPKSGTHVKPSPRRAVLLLVPKTVDGQIARIFREKENFLSHQKTPLKLLEVSLPQFPVFCSFSWILKRWPLFLFMSFSDLSQFN